MIFTTGYAVPQTVPPRSLHEILPTMYDLPSESIGEPGLPDEYHDLQPQLLSRTLALTDYSHNQWFSGSDLNLYYDVHHPLWYKQPDWFLAVGVPRLYDGHELRRSYVAWQEGHSPDVVIEFLSPGTEQEDLGRFYGAGDALGPSADSTPLGTVNGANLAAQSSPPPKFVVYEQHLRVPHYLVHNRKTQQLRYFQLMGRRYEEQQVASTVPNLWLADLQIGLGIWQGDFDGVEGQWLRWCDRDGHWLPTDTEQAQQAKEQERKAKEQAQAQIIQAAQNLLATGMGLEQVTEILGLSEDQQRQLQP